MGSILRLILCLVIFPAQLSAEEGFPAFNDTTPGALYLDYRRQNRVWSKSESGFVDAATKTSPPDAVREDRRILAMTAAGADVQFTANLAARLAVTGIYVKRRQIDDQEPSIYIDDTTRSTYFSADIAFINRAGLELFAGLTGYAISPVSESTSSDYASSETYYHASRIVTPRLGLARRASGWTGGAYYLIGKEGSRDYRKTATDGSEFTGSDTTILPTRIGVFGQVMLGGMSLDIEGVAVQAGEGGNRSPSGETVREDYLYARLLAAVPLAATAKISLQTIYQTMSYAANAYTTIDTIPVLYSKLFVTMGSDKSSAFLGAGYASGRDGQSVPEYNSRFALKAYTVTFGFNLGL